MCSDKIWLIITWKYTPNWDNVIIIQMSANSDFGLRARILQIGWFYRPKWKILEKSASKNNHIKLRFWIWILQSDNPETKVITDKHKFTSYPLMLLWDSLFINFPFLWIFLFPVLPKMAQSLTFFYIYSWGRWQSTVWTLL